MPTPTNEKVGQEIGVSHATVSRYRSGSRHPEIATMSEIADKFKWSIDDQYAAQQSGEYAREFEIRVVSELGRRSVVEDAAPDQQGGARKTAPHTPAA